VKGHFVNVTIDELGPCKKLLRVEIETEAVNAEFDSMVAEFRKNAQVPGFRVGKAPRPVIEKNYAEKISDEVKKKLIPDAYHNAVKEHNLKVVGYPDIEETQFAKGEPLLFTATVETEPDFELPDYKGLAVTVVKPEVADEEVEAAIEELRKRKSELKEVDRPAKEGDFTRANFSGTCDGKSIKEVVPDAELYHGGENMPLIVKPETFIPGFGEALIGVKVGEKKTIPVEFPADFSNDTLAGKKAEYEVELTSILEQVMPDLDDVFAQSFEAETLDALKAGVRADLENERQYQSKRHTRNQIIDALLRDVDCELPESALMKETRSVIYNIVEENHKRGISKELIDEHKDQIFSEANDSAKGRLKVSFLLTRIAEKEEITVDSKEMDVQIQMLAAQQKVKPQKLVQQLRENGKLEELHDQILSNKTLDFLTEKATVTEITQAEAEKMQEEAQAAEAAKQAAQAAENAIADGAGAAGAEAKAEADADEAKDAGDVEVIGEGDAK
jgi:trigger factor